MQKDKKNLRELSQIKLIWFSYFLRNETDVGGGASRLRKVDIWGAMPFSI